MNPKEYYTEIHRLFAEAPGVMDCFDSSCPVLADTARLFVAAYYDGRFSGEENSQRRCQKISAYTGILTDANEIAEILKSSAPHRLMRLYGVLNASYGCSSAVRPSAHFLDITMMGGQGEHDRVAQLSFYLERCRKVLSLSAPGDDLHVQEHGSGATPSSALQI